MYLPHAQRAVFWASSVIDPSDRQSWKTFGESGPGFEFIYRLYDSVHSLLYVGITWSPFVRWTKHSKVKSWWPEVEFAEVWRCRDEDARHWETRCIKEQMPKYNIQQAVKH